MRIPQKEKYLQNASLSISRIYRLLYFVPIKILFPIKIIVGKLKKETIRKLKPIILMYHFYVFFLSGLSIMVKFFENLPSWLLLRACIVKLLRPVFFRGIVI